MEVQAILKSSSIFCALLGALLLIGLSVTSPAADDADDCQSNDPEIRIRGCTNLLKRKLSGADQATVYIYRGIGHARIGNHAKAIQDFGQSIKLFPKRADQYYLRGVSRAAIGDTGPAITDFDAAIARDPNHADALTQRGRALLQIGQIDPAIADFTKAIANGDPPDAYFGRARAYIQQRNYAPAISDLNVVIAIFPKNSELLHQRAIAHAAVANFDAALADFSGILDMYPDATDILDGRGQVYAQAKEFGKAIADFDAAISIDPGRFETLNRRARAHLQSGSTDKAITDFTAAIAAKPDYADALYGRALAYVSIGEPSRGINDLNAALAIVPDHPDLLYYRGVAYADKGDVDAALADYDKVVEIQPDHPEVHYNRGLANARKGLTSQAIEDFDRMLALDPDHEGALHHRQLALQAQSEDPSSRAGTENLRNFVQGENQKPDASCSIDLTGQKWDRVTVARLFPADFDDWVAGEVQITETELTTPELEELSRFLGALSGIATGKSEKQSPLLRIQATRNYRNGEKALKVMIDTANSETAGLVAAVFESEENKKKVAAQGLNAKTLRGREAVFISEPPGAVVRVEDFGILSIQCGFPDCAADITAMIYSFELGCVSQFVSFDHRQRASKSSE